MKRPKFLLLDEATTGLDTSRSVELGKFCRVIADNFVPVIAALLQPPFRFLPFSKSSFFFPFFFSRF